MNRGTLSGYRPETPGRFVSEMLEWPDGANTGSHANPPPGDMELKVAHGLGVAPFDVRWVLVNVQPEGGYLVGDEVDINGALINIAIPTHWTTWANAAQCGLAINGPFTFLYYNRSTGANLTIDPNKWKLKVYAVR